MKIALRKFNADIYFSYPALDFSFIFSKNFLNKKQPKTVHQKFSTIYILLSLFQFFFFNDISSPLFL